MSYFRIANHIFLRTKDFGTEMCLSIVFETKWIGTGFKNRHSQAADTEAICWNQMGYYVKWKSLQSSLKNGARETMDINLRDNIQSLSGNGDCKLV